MRESLSWIWNFRCSEKFGAFGVGGITCAWTIGNGGWIHWAKVNVDGSFFPDSLRMGDWGIIRDADGNWITGFSGFMGERDNMEAEFQHDEVDIQHRHFVLIPKVKALLDRVWNMEFKFVFREANKLAYLLAKEGVAHSSHVMVLDDPPPEVATLVLLDKLSTFS
ncbi:Reverse transcriptase-like [Sesbania bispinosa]|nr:Reverse transcriptase-like [Sesbania bispinosa]